MIRGLLGVTLLAAALTTHAVGAAGPLDIGSRLELFVDDYLIARRDGGVELRLQRPIPREIVMKHDQAWEGNASGYHSVFQDGPIYRMYYKASSTKSPVVVAELQLLGEAIGKVFTKDSHRYLCYAESRDGIQWTKPRVNLFEYQGSTANNIVLNSATTGSLHPDAAHPSVFRDENPAAADDARYKAFVRSSKPVALLAFKSPDGIHWTPMVDRPVITSAPNFDSQNLAFWDPQRKEYRAYWRIYPRGVSIEEQKKAEGRQIKNYRAIRTAVSQDFIHWEQERDVVYEEAAIEDLYTNQIRPYQRAPHILIGFPTRYLDRGWSDSIHALPDQNARKERAAKGSPREATALTEGLFMTSRDRVTFKRWAEAFLRPGIERPGTWNYGQQMIGWHVVQTKSDLAGAPDELSLYATEHYAGDGGSHLRRYTLRLDGFVSAHAPMRGGELLTKAVRFQGGRLHLNFSTSAAGGIQVEIQDENGKPFPGFALGDCPPVFGDTVDRPVAWNGGSDVSALAGKSVRLRFVLKDSDLFSFQFR